MLDGALLHIVVGGSLILGIPPGISRQLRLRLVSSWMKHRQVVFVIQSCF